jgi:hypothetical protein
LLNIGVEGSYRFELGTRAQLHEQVGIGLQSASRSVRRFLQTLASGRGASTPDKAVLQPVDWTR